MSLKGSFETHQFTLTKPSTQEEKFSFERRLNQAKIIVIGASYLECDHSRFSKHDPNYIGLGSDCPNLEQIQLDFNPLNKNWNDKGYNLKALLDPYFKGSHQFETLIIDRGVLHHIENPQTLIDMIKYLVSERLRKGGQIIFPSPLANHKYNHLIDTLKACEVDVRRPKVLAKSEHHFQAPHNFHVFQNVKESLINHEDLVGTLSLTEQLALAMENSKKDMPKHMENIAPAPEQAENLDSLSDAARLGIAIQWSRQQKLHEEQTIEQKIGSLNDEERLKLAIEESLKEAQASKSRIN